MELIRTFQSELLEASLWKEVLYDAKGSVDSYWIEFKNGRGETFCIHRGQMSQLYDLLMGIGGCLNDIDDIAEDERFHKAAEDSLSKKQGCLDPCPQASETINGLAQKESA